MMAVGRMRVMCTLFVVACFMMLCGFLVVSRGVPVMFGCLFMVVGTLMLSHGSSE